MFFEATTSLTLGAMPANPVPSSIDQFLNAVVLDWSIEDGFRSPLGIKQTSCLLLKFFFPQIYLCVMRPKLLATTFIVLMPLIPSMTTLTLNSPLKFLCFASLTTCSFLQQATILIHCPGNGVYYINELNVSWKTLNLPETLQFPPHLYFSQSPSTKADYS